MQNTVEKISILSWYRGLNTVTCWIYRDIYCTFRPFPYPSSCHPPFRFFFTHRTKMRRAGRSLYNPKKKMPLTPFLCNFLIFSFPVLHFSLFSFSPTAIPPPTPPSIQPNTYPCGCIRKKNLLASNQYSTENGLRLQLREMQTD